MKKKLALLLSAVMIVGMVPMTAFAVTTNEMSKIVTGSDEALYTTTEKAPSLKITDKNLNDVSSATFKLTLSASKWKIPATSGGTDYYKVGDSQKTYTDATATGAGTVKVQLLSDTQAIVQVDGLSAASNGKSTVNLPLFVQLDGEGDANVTIDPMESVLSAGTYKFANVIEGATSTTIEKKTDVQESGDTIKPIIVTETTAGSLEGSEKGYFKLKLTSGFEFVNAKAATATTTVGTTGLKNVYEITDTNVKVSSYPSIGTNYTAYVDSDAEEMYIVFSNGVGTNGFKTPNASTISITGLAVGFDSDDVESGDIAEITVSGYNMDKGTVEVATAQDFGMTFKAENKTLPEFVSGRYDDEVETLKVTMKETIKGSWINTRKTTITFPEGVKVVEATIDGKTLTAGSTSNGVTTKGSIKTKSDTSYIELSSTGTASGKVEYDFKFELSVSPEFTGDIVATLGGAGVEADMTAVVGTVVAPIKVEADTNEVSIDYRNVEIGDIVITESFAGALEKGKTLVLQIEDNLISFDGTPKVEVVEGDVKIEDVSTKGGTLSIEVKSASSKTPAVLKVTDVALYLNRSIPAGKFALEVVTDGNSDNKTNAIFQNTSDESAKKAKDSTELFDVDSLVILEDFIDVVTAGRDQDDSTFTTTISVTIGADKLIAGKTEIALDVPAYISEGYTMLPVRAVTEALSGAAIVRWDDATKTVTITFGSRVISMTVGSKTMMINGVAVQMAKACEITDSRAFIPLRDLGYALGLNDSKINWDDATKTATLN